MKLMRANILTDFIKKIKGKTPYFYLHPCKILWDMTPPCSQSMQLEKEVLTRPG